MKKKHTHTHKTKNRVKISNNNFGEQFSQEILSLSSSQVHEIQITNGYYLNID